MCIRDSSGLIKTSPSGIVAKMLIDRAIKKSVLNLFIVVVFLNIVITILFNNNEEM